MTTPISTTVSSTAQAATRAPHPLAPATQEQLTAAQTEATRPGMFAQPGALTPTGIGAADASAPVPVGAAPRPTVAPYHCDTCGSDNPYRSGRMKHRGGLGCKPCRSVTKAIQDAHLGTLHRLSRPAYQLGVHGEQKRAILRCAEAEARQVWAEASASFGIAVPSAELAVIEVIIAEVREMAAAGVITPDDLVNVGTDLLNIAQDAEMALAGSAVAA